MTVANESLQDYVYQLFGGEDQLLRAIRQDAERQNLPAIQVPPELARLLEVLVRQSGARAVLEIGTLFGYSAIIMARALPSDGRLLTLEVNSKHAMLARENIERAQLSHKVEVREGAALDLLASLQEYRFDLVFIDADKESYTAYLDWALTLTHSGSIIVADNIWRSGAVVHPAEDDPSARAMDRFNRKLAATPGVATTIVPRLTFSDAATVSVVL